MYPPKIFLPKILRTEAGNFGPIIIIKYNVATPTKNTIQNINFYN